MNALFSRLLLPAALLCGLGGSLWLLPTAAAQAPAAAGAGAGGFKDLQVLPKTISKADLPPAEPIPEPTPLRTPPPPPNSPAAVTVAISSVQISRDCPDEPTPTSDAKPMGHRYCLKRASSLL